MVFDRGKEGREGIESDRSGYASPQILKMQESDFPDVRDIRRTLHSIQADKYRRGPGVSFTKSTKQSRIYGDDVSGEQDSNHEFDTQFNMNLDVVRNRAPSVGFSKVPQRFGNDFETDDSRRDSPYEKTLLNTESSYRAIEYRSRSANFAQMSGRNSYIKNTETEDIKERRERFLDELDFAAAYAQTLPRKAAATFNLTKRFEVKKQDETTQSDMRQDFPETLLKTDFLRPRVHNTIFTPVRENKKRIVHSDLQSELSPNFDFVRPQASACHIAPQKQSRQLNILGLKYQSPATSNTSPGPGSYATETAFSIKGAISQTVRNNDRNNSKGKGKGKFTFKGKVKRILQEARKSEIDPEQAQMKLWKKSPSYGFAPLKEAKVKRSKKTSQMDKDSNVVDKTSKSCLYVKYDAIERRVKGGSWGKLPETRIAAKAPHCCEVEPVKKGTCHQTRIDSIERGNELAIIRPSRPSWTFFRAPKESTAKSKTKDLGYLNADVSFIRPRSKVANFSIRDSLETSTIILHSDNLFQVLRKIYKRSNLRNDTVQDMATSDNVFTSWQALQRHVPVPAWSVASSRWRDKAKSDDCIVDLYDQLYELAAAIKLTRPSSRMCIINPLPHTVSHLETHKSSMQSNVERISRHLELHRARKAGQDANANFYDYNIDIVRAKSLNTLTLTTQFSKQTGRDDRAMQTSKDVSISAAVGQYTPIYDIVEPRVKGMTEFHTTTFPGEAQQNDNDIDGDVLILHPDEAKDCLLPKLNEGHNVNFPDKSKSSFVEEEQNEKLTKAIKDYSDIRLMFARSTAHGGDEFIRPRLSSGMIDMKRQSNYHTEEKHNQDSNTENDNLGEYKAFESWLDIQPSVPAWTFGKSDVEQSAERQLQEGDKIDIDIQKSLKVTSQYSTPFSVIILPEQLNKASTHEENRVDFYDVDKMRKHQPMYVDYSKMLPRPVPKNSLTSARDALPFEKIDGHNEYDDSILSSWPKLTTANSGFTFAKSNLCRGEEAIDSFDKRPGLNIDTADLLTKPNHMNGDHRTKDEKFQLMRMRAGHSGIEELDKDKLTSWISFLDDDYDKEMKHHIPVHSYVSNQTMNRLQENQDMYEIDIGGIDGGCYDPSLVFHPKGGTKILRWGDGPTAPISTAPISSGGTIHNDGNQSRRLSRREALKKFVRKRGLQDRLP